MDVDQSPGAYRVSSMVVNAYNGVMSGAAEAPALEAIPLRTRGCCQAVAPRIPGPDAEECAAVFRALGDTTRLQMIHMLAEATEPVCVCDFTAAFDLGQPTISHHLAKLREAGLIVSTRRGIWTFHQLNPEMSAASREVVALLH
jgi:ArsR family transcriptional regulator